MEEDADENEEEAYIDVFPRQYANRFLLRFGELRFDLQLNLAEEGKRNIHCNVSTPQ